MDELHILARAVAERFLASNNDPVIDPESRLFQDLQQMAITALEPQSGEFPRAGTPALLIH